MGPENGGMEAGDCGRKRTDLNVARTIMMQTKSEIIAQLLAEKPYTREPEKGASCTRL